MFEDQEIPEITLPGKETVAHGFSDHVYLRSIDEQKHFAKIIGLSIHKAKLFIGAEEGDFSVEQIVTIGIDTNGSTSFIKCCIE